mgnify:CR=1 FL=1
MKLTTTIDITPEEALQLAGNPIYSWLNAIKGDTAGKLERNENKEGDCMGTNETPVSGLSRPFSDMYKYTVVEPYRNMESFNKVFGTWCGVNPLMATGESK